MINRLLIIQIACLLFLNPVLAQPVQYPFLHLDVSNGLSHNQVNTIIKDAKGFMWFGTASGLNRYDGYSFRTFRHKENDSTSLNEDMIVKIQEGPHNKFWIDTRSGQCIFDPVSEKAMTNTMAWCRQLSLPAAFVLDIAKDKQGCFWFAQTGVGASRYNPAAHTVRRFPRQPVQPNTPDIADMASDNAGNIWIMYSDGLLEAYNTATEKKFYSNAGLFKQQGARQYRLFADADNDLWIFTLAYPQGVFCLGKNNNLIHYHRDAANSRLNNNLVTGLQQDNNGNIWIITDHGGVNLLNKKTGAISYLENKPEDIKSISQNSVNAIYRDNTGIIWLGTYKRGVNYYHENIIKFPVYRHLLSDAHSLPYDDVNRFVEDEKGNLWIGTNGGGLIYFDRSTGVFRTFKHNPANANSVSNDVIVSLCIDHNKKLWVGSYYGGLDCYDGQRFIHYKNDPADTNSLSDNSIWEIYEDAQQQLWVGTLAGGLNRFEPETNKFYHYRQGANSLNSTYISALAEDRYGNLWIGTESGINVRNKQTGRITLYLHDSKDPRSLSSNSITALLPDSRGNMWVTTRDGLNFFDEASGSFRHFSQADGLSENNILTIMEDNEHTLWLGTTNGISRAWIQQYNANGEMHVQFRNYDERDGLQGREFNENAALKTRRGELIFGGANGFNIINPDAISHNTIVPEVVLTDLRVFDKSTQPGELVNNRVLLTTAISEVKEIRLKYYENIFSLEFAALNYSNPEKNQYAYRLEGFNNDWLTTDGTHRTVTYTNLDPGKYIFRVKASNGDGVWNEKGAALVVTILPPFWRTIPAFIIYALLIAGILIAARRLTIQRAHMRFQLAQQKKEAERVHELDLLKLKFFTNVSHEFRTPLSLIMAPVEKMVKQTNEPEQKKQYQLIYRNARRLLALVNQLLDFRKLEMQELRLYPSHGDIVPFVKEVAFSFTDMAGAKHINFNFTSDIPALQISFDPDKLERILFNLLSNAFKFTREYGNIEVSLGLQPGSGELQHAQYVFIRVKDSGIGIPPEDQERIFERFFQHDVPGTILNQGSGIGLAISKEFVRLHKGTIAVESEPGKGTCFTVLLPVTAPVEKPETAPVEEKLTPVGAEEPTDQPGKGGRKKPVILIVDDNEDIRFYLKDNLRRNYIVYEAVNGAEGWEKTKQLQPDLVVSDVMMPVMDGMELCRTIKHDKHTSHIPVILLTARSAAEPKMEAFGVGANDYITKPFSYEMLQSRIKNLLAQQEAMRKLFQKQVEVNPSEISVTSVDEQFIRQSIETVEQNISNPDFSVEDLSRALHMSRVALYKKLLALTGKSPLDFIKTIRLKRAAQLLEKSQYNISEVAYEVGFNNPKYFARTFKKEFGVLPSEYAAQNPKTTPNP